MKYLNGIEQPAAPSGSVYEASFIKDLPEAVDSVLISNATARILKMNKIYNILVRRNRLLSAVSALQAEINELDDEINRL